MGNYYAGKRPDNINTVEEVKVFQRALGVPVTGVWDSRTKTACLIQPAKAKKVGNDIAKLREASKSNVNTPQIKPAGVTPYNWAKVNVLPTASDYAGSKKAASTSTGMLGAGTIAYLQNHREKNKSGDLSGLGRSSSSTASSGSGYHPGYTGGLGGWNMTNIWKSMPEREPVEPSLVWLNSINRTINNEKRIALEEGRSTPPIPERERSEEHKNAIQIYNENHAEHMAMRKSKMGKSYDPLSNDAAEKLDVVERVRKELNNLKTQTRRFAPHTDVFDDIQKKEDEFYQALDEYASIPILLTDETLSNPYAAKYAEVLSIRMPISDEAHAIIRASMDELGEEIMACQNTGDWANACRASDVWFALEGKRQYFALMMGALNNLMYDIPEIASLTRISKVSPYKQQLDYMSGVQAIQEANPQMYELGSTAIDIANISSAAKDIYKEPVKGLVNYMLDDMIGRATDRYSHHMEETAD